MGSVLVDAPEIAREELKGTLSRIRQFIMLGELDDGLSLLSEMSKDISKLHDSDELLASYLADLGRIYVNKGDLRKAEDFLERAIQKSTLGSQARAYALNHRGNIEWVRGNLEQAENYHLKALEIRKRVDDKPGIVSSLNNLGLINSSMGKNEKAIDCYKESIELGKKIGTLETEAILTITLNNLAAIYHDFGELENAEVLLYDGREIAQKISKHDGEALCTLGLGLISWAKGDLPTAQSMLNESLSMLTNLDMKGYLYVENLSRLAGVLTDLHEYEKAVNTLDTAKNTANNLDSDFAQLSVFYYRGYLERIRGNNASAKRLYENCLFSARSQKNFEYTLKSLVELAYLSLTEYQLTLEDHFLMRAQQLVQEILDAAVENYMIFHLVQVRIIQGMLLTVMMKYNGAIKTFKEAIRLAERKKLPIQMAKARKEMKKAEQLRDRVRKIFQPRTEEEQVDEVRAYLEKYQQLLKTSKS